MASVFGMASPDYHALVEYVNIASIAYCINRGLKPGKLLSFCTLDRCTNDALQDLEIVDTFDFNNWAEIGAGFYAIDKQNQRIILGFRGTSSIRDWKGNIDAIPVPYRPIVRKRKKVPTKCENCLVHRGFYQFLERNCMDIIEKVLSLKEEHHDFKLVVVGHSLGGALAILSGVELQILGHKTLVVSFASPKVGNKAMMKFIDDQFNTRQVVHQVRKTHSFDHGFIRVVHKNDPVPYLPPGIYAHGGCEYYINKGDLPHGPKNLERDSGRDLSELEFLQQSLGMIDLHSVWGRKEHRNYFITVPGCADGQ